MTGAHIYKRRNGSFGASCGVVKDTGHHITEDNGRFTVWSIIEDGTIAANVTQQEAEKAVAKEWHES